MFQKITPFLWFDSDAEEAAEFYTSIFPNSSIGEIVRYDEQAAAQTGRAAGSAMTVPFTLSGQHFTAINGGPRFRFNEAISFVINCETQEEVDRYWDSLTANGGEESMCGWLKDRFGVSWQVVPTILPKLMQSGGGRSERAVQALLQMKKISIAEILEAADRIN